MVITPRARWSAARISAGATKRPSWGAAEGASGAVTSRQSGQAEHHFGESRKVFTAVPRGRRRGQDLTRRGGCGHGDTGRRAVAERQVEVLRHEVGHEAGAPTVRSRT